MTVPRTPPVSPPEQSFDVDDFKKRLTDEYKILQDKIDKIGSFRFTIKGWSVTAVIAASAAGTTANRLLTALMISAGLSLMLCFFFHFEFEQVGLSRLFGDRARRLEDGFRLIERKETHAKAARILVPYTANEIGLAGFRRRLLHTSAVSRGRDANLWTRWWRQWWPIARQSDIWFYSLLVVLAFLPLVPRYHAISTHWKQLTNNHHPTAVTSDRDKK